MFIKIARNESFNMSLVPFIFNLSNFADDTKNYCNFKRKNFHLHERIYLYNVYKIYNF